MIYFTAHTFKCVCHCRRAMFRVLGVYNFAAMVNFTVDDVFLLANYIFKIFKLRNLIKTDKMVQKWLIRQMVKKYSYCPIGKFYNYNRNIR